MEYEAATNSSLSFRKEKVLVESLEEAFRAETWALWLSGNARFSFYTQ